MLAPVLAGLLKNGGLSKVLSGLQANGLSSQADSWVSTGPNEAIDPRDVESALGDQVGQVADQLGIDNAQASELLAGILPDLVNNVTPDGELPGDDDLDRLARALEGFADS
jgi:uncharacterized protein YidB (DUF937 family)